MKEFLTKFNLTNISEKALKGGTQSSVILINDKYLVKSNSPAVIKAESEFCDFYPNLFQKKVYVSSDFSYIVYEFIDGKTSVEKYDIENVTSNILNVIKQYKPYPDERFGYLDQPVKSIEEFLLSEIEEYHLLDSYLTKDDYLIAAKAIKELSNYSFKKQLIHGDLGTHNIIFNNKTFAGIIDPSPIIFDGLYDFIYYICSDLPLLQKYSLVEISNMLNEELNKVKSLYTIILYARLLRCLKYYPEEIDEHIIIWEKLKNNNL